MGHTLNKRTTSLVLLLSALCFLVTFTGWVLRPSYQSTHSSFINMEEHYRGLEQFWSAKLEQDRFSLHNREKLADVKSQLARVTGDDSLYVEAETLVREAIGLRKKSNPRLQAQLAKLVMAQHKFFEAWELADRAYKKSQAPWILGIRGDAALGYGWYEKALEDFKAYKELAPGYSSWVRLAHVYEILGREKEALELLRKAKLNYKGTAPEPKAWIRLRLGIYYLNRGQLEQAEASFRESLDIDPGYFLAQEHLAEIFELQGKDAEAEYYLEKAIQTNRAPELLLRLAAIKENKSSANLLISEARAEIKESAMNNDAHIREYLELLLDDRSNPALALQLATKDLALRKLELHANFLAAKAYRLLGNYEMAKLHIVQALRYHSQKEEYLKEKEQINLTESA